MNERTKYEIPDAKIIVSDFDFFNDSLKVFKLIEFVRDNPTKNK